MFGVKNHPRFVINNEELIKKTVGAERVREVVGECSQENCK